MTSNSLMPQMTLDDIIEESELIVIGKVRAIQSPQWRSANEKRLEDATAEEIFQAGGLFTDSIISIAQILKGDNKASTILVRSFIGETEQVRWVNDSEFSFERGKTYLLFLAENYGPSANVEPGSYISVNSYEGVYEIVDGKAISRSDEWVLDELLSHIQTSLLSQPTVDIPDTPEAQEIMQRIETVYDIEAEASYLFDITKFLDVFINDPRYVVNPDALEFIRTATDNPSLETAGYLDYKVAYYDWWKEGTLRFNALREKAIAENRNVTDDELNTFLASKWGKIPGQVKDPMRHWKIKFTSIKIDGDIATVILDFGARTKELILILVDGQWYITGETGISLYP